MNYALTVRDYIITGVHESLMLFGPWTFEKNPALCNDKIVIIKETGKYRKGMDIRCFEADGTPKDAVWCIQQGLMKLPPNTEIIGGELVDITKPEADAPESVKSIIDGLRGELELLKTQIAEQDIKIGGIETIVNPIVKEPIKTIIG